MKSKKVTKPKPKPRKQPKKIKQKQIAKQSVKVNVQSSGGSGGGGSSVPMMPQYVPNQYHQSIPRAFQDNRGEDVILQKLSEIVDKFNSKPQPIEDLPKSNPLPVEYVDSVVDAGTQTYEETSPELSLIPRSNRSIVSSTFQSAPPANQNTLSTNTPLRLSNTEFNPSVYIGGKNLFSEEPEKPKQSKKKVKEDGPKIEVLKSVDDLRRQTEKARDAKAQYALKEQQDEDKAIKYFEEKRKKKAVARLKEYADSLNSDLTYRELKRDYNEDKKREAENFISPSPVKEAKAKIEAKLKSSGMTAKQHLLGSQAAPQVTTRSKGKKG